MYTIRVLIVDLPLAKFLSSNLSWSLLLPALNTHAKIQTCSVPTIIPFGSGTELILQRKWTEIMARDIGLGKGGHRCLDITYYLQDFQDMFPHNHKILNIKYCTIILTYTYSHNVVHCCFCNFFSYQIIFLCEEICRIFGRKFSEINMLYLHDFST